MSEPATTQPAQSPRIDPKENFLRLEEYVNQWRQISRNIVTHTAITYALAEYANSKPSSEQMKGAFDFIDTLLNLAEPKSPPRAPFPDKRLTPVPFDSVTREEKKK
jgi:hypothetical protein